MSGAQLAWTVDDVFTPAECDALFARASRVGFAPAPITTGRGFVMRPDVRNNARAMLDDHAIAADLFARVRPHVPATLDGLRAAGANERLRFYLYEPGQRFAPHRDGAFVRSPRERSLLTLMVYLNDDFEGGATRFFELGLSVAPKRGAALLFRHHLLHEGAVVESGEKHVLRSDVMYVE